MTRSKSNFSLTVWTVPFFSCHGRSEVCESKLVAYMRSVCLVGTSHNYQRDSSLVQESQIGEFRKMLCETIQREGLRGIAEEMSKDGLHLSRNRRSVGKQLGDELGLVHMTIPIPMRPR